MCFVSRWYFAVCVSIFGRSKPLPYRHGVPYPPYGGISSRQRLAYHHASACISSHLGVYIIAPQGASRIVDYRWLCALHREEQAPPLPARCAVSAIWRYIITLQRGYHQDNVLYIITPRCVYHRTTMCLVPLVVDVSNFVRVAGENLCAN